MIPYLRLRFIWKALCSSFPPHYEDGWSARTDFLKTLGNLRHHRRFFKQDRSSYFATKAPWSLYTFFMGAKFLEVKRFYGKVCDANLTSWSNGTSESLQDNFFYCFKYLGLPRGSYISIYNGPDLNLQKRTGLESTITDPELIYYDGPD